MKKAIIPYIATLFIFTSFVIFYSFDKPVESVSVTATEESKPIYLIKSLDGYACVFVSNGGKLVFQTDIDLRSLRRFDAEKIENGILIYSEDELNRFLEDFGS